MALDCYAFRLSELAICIHCTLHGKIKLYMYNSYITTIMCQVGSIELWLGSYRMLDLEWLFNKCVKMTKEL